MLVQCGGGRLVGGLLAVMVAVGAAGCGSDDDGGDADASGGSGLAAEKAELRDDYDAFLDAVGEGRWNDACDAVASDYMDVFVSRSALAKTCPGTMRALGQVGDQPRPWIGEVELRDARNAVAESKTRQDRPGLRMRFVKEDGRWKMAGVTERQP